MDKTENKQRLSITTIVFLVVIVLLASISGWNYYQTNKKISSLLNESSMLQSNYQIEISSLEDIIEQTQSELLEQKKIDQRDSVKNWFH